MDLAAEKKINMPITEAVAQVLFHGKSPKEAVPSLMLRDPKSETVR